MSFIKTLVHGPGRGLLFVENEPAIFQTFYFCKREKIKHIAIVERSFYFILFSLPLIQILRLSRTVSASPAAGLWINSISEEKVVFNGYSNGLNHICVHSVRAIWSNMFSATSGNGQKWTSSKRFTPCSHLYLTVSTCD